MGEAELKSYLTAVGPWLAAIDDTVEGIAPSPDQTIVDTFGSASAGLLPVGAAHRRIPERARREVLALIANAMEAGRWALAAANEFDANRRDGTPAESPDDPIGLRVLLDAATNADEVGQLQATMAAVARRFAELAMVQSLGVTRG